MEAQLAEVQAAHAAAESRARDLADQLAALGAELSSAHAQAAHLERLHVDERSRCEDLTQQVMDLQGKLAEAAAAVAAATAAAESAQSASRSLPVEDNQATSTGSSLSEAQAALLSQLQAAHDQAVAQVASLTAELERVRGGEAAAADLKRQLMELQAAQAAAAPRLAQVDALAAELDQARQARAQAEAALHAEQRRVQEWYQQHGQAAAAASAAGGAGGSGSVAPSPIRTVDKKRDDSMSNLAEGVYDPESAVIQVRRRAGGPRAQGPVVCGCWGSADVPYCPYCP